MSFMQSCAFQRNDRYNEGLIRRILSASHLNSPRIADHLGREILLRTALAKFQRALALAALVNVSC